MSTTSFGDLHEIALRNGIYKGKEFQGRGVRLVKMNQLFGQRRIRSDAGGYELIELTDTERGLMILRKSDLLFSRTSVVADGVGKCSLVTEAQTDLTWDSNIIRVRLDATRTSPDFYFYYFNSPQGRDAIKRISGGVAVTTITGSGLAAMQVPFPPLVKQHRIASILSAYDDLIENNTRRVAIVEEMARRIYEEWFVRFRFPGHGGVRMVESEVGLVPEGWRVRALCDLVDEVRDSVSPDAVAPETPYVGLEHIPRRSIALAEWGQAAEVGSTKLRFREGDILFGKIRPYFHKVAVAPVAGVVSSDAIVMRAKREQDWGLALAVASSDAFVAHATQTSNGTKMPRANWGVLRQYPVPTPPPALHTRFEEFMAPVVAAVVNHVLRNRNLRATRDLLLPKLISGELDVSAAPEPQAVDA